MNEVLNENKVKNGGLIAKRILLILSIVFYTGMTIFLLIMLISVLGDSSDSQGLAFAAFIVLLLIFGSSFYFVSFALSLSSLIVSRKNDLGKNLFPILFMIMPFVTWVILFIIPYVLA